MNNHEDHEDDEIVAEVRDIRAKILAECDGDLRKVAERARKIQLPPGMKRISSPAELKRETQSAEQPE